MTARSGRWKLTDVGDGGIGDEQQPLDRRPAVGQVGGEICDLGRLTVVSLRVDVGQHRRGTWSRPVCVVTMTVAGGALRAMASRAAAPSEAWASGEGQEWACGAAKLRALAVVASAPGRPPSFSHLSMLSSMQRVCCLAAGADIGSSPHSGRDRTPTARVAPTPDADWYVSRPEMSGFGA